MEGAKGGCLAVLMADAGWQGRVTGLSDESRIPSQVLPDVAHSTLHRMRPDILLFEKSARDSTVPRRGALAPLSVQNFGACPA